MRNICRFPSPVFKECNGVIGEKLEIEMVKSWCPVDECIIKGDNISENEKFNSPVTCLDFSLIFSKIVVRDLYFFYQWLNHTQPIEECYNNFGINKISILFLKQSKE